MGLIENRYCFKKRLVNLKMQQWKLSKKKHGEKNGKKKKKKEEENKVKKKQSITGV